MIRLFFWVPVAFFLATAFDVATAAPENTGAAELSHDLERQTFDLVNAYRTGQGFPPLVWSREMAEIAREHSRAMATDEVAFGHDGFDDRMDKLKGVFTGMRGGGENVLESDETSGLASFAVATWLKSPPHLHNIRGDFTYSGLGIWRSRGGVFYFTQIFVKTGG